MTLGLENWLIVVPARLSSQRLPNKPLQMLGGKPLITRVYDNLRPLEADGAKIVVAVDAPATRDACSSHKIPWIMTKDDHPSGTDRCNEAAQHFHHKWIMNVQGDEPFINLGDLRDLAAAMQSSNSQMGTLAIKQHDHSKYHDPNVVKVVMSQGRAIYFSRAPVPFDRDGERLGQATRTFWQHIGVYAYTREGLAKFCGLPTSQLENIEKLEQLRAIENGWVIQVTPATHVSLGIDTHEDLHLAEKLLAQI